MRCKLRGKIICPECGEIGRLEIQSGDKYRVNHDKMKQGIRISNRCYLGSISKHIKNLESASRTREDLLDPILIEELNAELNDRNKIHEEIQNSPYATLIARIIHLSKKFSFGWSSEKHYLVKQATCPYCTQRIAVRFIRIGKNPDYTDGKYNVEKLDLEKGNYGYTSYFGDRNPSHKGWLDGIYKGSSKIKSDSFIDDLEESKFKPKKNKN